jgi:transcription elongation factor Elf1
MLVSYDKALFTLTCPQCGSTVSAMCTIPDSLRGKIIEGAHQVDAGMGRDL